MPHACANSCWSVPDNSDGAPPRDDVGSTDENGCMGRGDGSERRVSPPGADDAGTRILHVDMDAFYASVEILDNPDLAGHPVIVGGQEGRGVVSSCNYEARRYGVRSAMSMSQALRLCPTARVVDHHFDRYLSLSREVMDIFRSVTPLVEPLSIDEAFLDVSGARRLWGSPAQIGHRLREQVRAHTGLVCSVGVAATKHVAKIASTLTKPNGLLVVSEAETQGFLDSLPVRAVWGIGPTSAAALEARALHTIADIRSAPRRVLEQALGAAGAARVWDLAHGHDPRPVETHRVEKSIGHEETFRHDVSDGRVLRSELRRLSDRVAVRLRASGWEAGAVAMKMRFADFSTLSRSQTLSEPSDVGQRIGEVALRLFDTVERAQPVRLIGVRAEKLRAGGAGPLALWDDDEPWRRVDAALDGARDRFGGGAVTRASVLGPPRDIGALPTNPLLPRES